MITWIVVAVAVIAAAIGLLMLVDDDNNDDVDRAATVLAGSVAVLAGALIYTMALDDYDVRRRVLGEDEADRRGRADQPTAERDRT